jgi:hypothetical protein
MCCYYFLLYLECCCYSAGNLIERCVGGEVCLREQGTFLWLLHLEEVDGNLVVDERKFNIHTEANQKSWVPQVSVAREFRTANRF